MLLCINTFGQSPANPYNENLVPYRNVEGKWGYLDAGTGKVVIPARYYRVELFKGNTALVVNEKMPPHARAVELYGLIDTSGKELIPVTHDYVHPVKARSGDELDDLYHFSGEEGWGIAKADGQWLIAPGEYSDDNNGYPNYEFYDRDRYLVNNRFYFENGQKYQPPTGHRIERVDRDNRFFHITPGDSPYQKGLSDWRGNILLPATYMEIRVYAEDNRIIASGDDTFSDDDLAFIARVDEIGEKNLNEADAATLQALIEKVEKREAAGRLVENHLFDLNGKEIARFHTQYLPIAFDGVIVAERRSPTGNDYFSFVDGSPMPPHQAGKGNWRVFKDEQGLCGLADPAGKIVLPARYRSLSFYDKDRIVAHNPAAQGEDYWHQHLGVINTKGEVIVPFEYRQLWPMEDAQSFIALHKDHMGYGVIDARGNIVIPFLYEGHLSFSDGLAIVQDSVYNQGVIDTLGREVIPLAYSKIYRTLDVEPLNNRDPGRLLNVDRYFKVERDGLWGMLDRHGREVIPMAYGLIFTAGESFERRWVEVSDPTMARKGLVNILTGVTIAPQYKDIFPLGNVIKVTLPESHFYELLDTEGNLLPGGPYTKMEYERKGHGCFIAEKEGKFGGLDIDGKTLLPFVYDRLHYASPGLFQAQKEGRYFFVNREGREYIAHHRSH
ncbi:WG repeat-containing protein [Parapedobacter tibetensis]|uniref:WG repeat-containing protein n=1 Tax=Parapedobacter tibetensis TaxID=2972951 RepID=UPI00214D1743|nr:WG repeat-containing protein [Parapedobacter tibetensis]